MAFTADNLKKSMGPDMFSQLQGAAIDKGSAFLSGQITSSMNKVMSSKEVVGAIQVATKGIGAGAAVIGTIQNPQLIADLTNKIVLCAVDEITKEFSTLLGKIAGKAVQIPMSVPSKIMSATQAHFNAKKKSLGQLVKEVSSEQQELAKAEAESLDLNVQSEQVNNALSKLNEAKAKINAALEVANYYVTEACKYIEEGPDMLASEVDKIISAVVEDATKQVNQTIADVEKDVDQFCDKQAEKAGQMMADVYNAALRKVAEAQVAVVKTLKQKAAAIAFKVKQKAAFQVMALTGVNVPV